MNKIVFPLVSDDLEHKLNADVKYNPYILEVLQGKKSMHIMHTLDARPVIKYTAKDRLLDLSKQKKYERRTYEYKPALHWGQLKLF